jgi:riboflavin kinase / FMN adenylyltransferase
MHIQRGFQQPEHYRGGWVAIGNFDGVHRGHQSMLATLVRRARESNTPAVVMTFDPHPIAVLRPHNTPSALSLLSHKLQLFERHGVDTVIVYPTDPALLALTPAEFFRDIVLGELQTVGLVEGPNFFFGHDRAGNVATLRMLCEASGRELDVVSAVFVRDRMVSSSEIRSLIASGRMADAVEMLGHPYCVTGVVGSGAGRGHTLGFPTANLFDIVTLLPPDGVYAGVCTVPSPDRGGHSLHPQPPQVASATFAAAINLGPNPTFGESARKFEVHLLEFSGDLRGHTLDVGLLARIRDTRRFDSVDDLRRQLEQDVAAVRAVSGSYLSETDS